MAEFRAIRAFGHVVTSIYRNFGPAVRMSWPWIAIYAALQFCAAVMFPDLVSLLAGEASDPARIGVEAWLAFIALTCASAIPFSCVAVNWHRFMLVGEEAEGWERVRIGGTVWRYVGNMLLAVLLVLPIVAILSFVIAFIAGAVFNMFSVEDLNLAMAMGAIIAVLPTTAMLVIVQRLSLKFPAIALDRRDYGFGDAWSDSKGNNLRLIGFMVMLMALTIGTGWLASAPLAAVATLSGEPSGLMESIGATWHLAVTSMGWIVGINSITILYGIFAEHRDF